ncbi:hypothetical protein ABFS82_13G133200 [Erythranthe guttata]|nr:PREDICTED: uncharacterized protein LOC105968321 [Erythranthe guttata]|eukprot:XP_012848404.1 PREDICTED: uncharacterized protein LOC105968321 [Erythranthe guttata]
MALKTDPLHFILLIILLSVTRSIDSATTAGEKLLHLGGTSQPIIAPEEDRKVVEIADFAVDKHNQLAKTNLKLSNVINGTMTVLGGTYYELAISAVDRRKANAAQNYATLVYEKPWQHLKILVSFKEIPISV